jgi:RNA 3'-phosphate cyclase
VPEAGLIAAWNHFCRPSTHVMKLDQNILRIPEGCIQIDGSHGEGGGQILRTACALSALTGIRCKVTNVRGGRERPGLRPQHIAALRGLIRISSAATTPLAPGATEVEFTPGRLRGGTIRLQTGTAGSIGLVLQCLLIAGVGVPAPLELDITGGTDVPGAPTCTYLKHVALPLLGRMGYEVDMEISQWGYVPKGGGRVRVRLEPPRDRLLALTLAECSEVRRSGGISHASSVLASRQVAERQRNAAQRMLTEYLHAPSRLEVHYSPTRSVGSSVVVWAETAEAVIGASCLGRPGLSAEQVAERAAQALIRTYHSGASLDPWMGDQILPYMALTGAPNEISVPYLTRHMLTNMWVVEKFLNVRFYTEEREQRVRIVSEPSPT